MKKFTNHTPGARGINLVGGVTKWIEPGQTVEIEQAHIAGPLPDLGKPAGTKGTNDDADLEGLKRQVTELTKQVDTLSKDKSELTKQVETLSKKA